MLNNLITWADLIGEVIGTGVAIIVMFFFCRIVLKWHLTGRETFKFVLTLGIIFFVMSIARRILAVSLGFM